LLQLWTTFHIPLGGIFRLDWAHCIYLIYYHVTFAHLKNDVSVVTHTGRSGLKSVKCTEHFILQPAVILASPQRKLKCTPLQTSFLWKANVFVFGAGWGRRGVVRRTKKATAISIYANEHLDQFVTSIFYWLCYYFKIYF
jgi:hypothetical protein